MKVGGKELSAAIRSIVREELKRALPGLIREHLSENYLRKMMKESREDESGPLQFDQGRDQNVPSPKKRDDSGIYDEQYSDDLDNDKLAAEATKRNAMNSALLSRSNPLSSIYEDIKSPHQSEGVSTQLLESTGLDFKKMARLAGVLENKNGPMQTTDDAKLRELERRRKALEVPVK